MNDNETVDKVCCEMLAIRDCDGEYISELDDIASRILSAHEREITANDAEIEKLRSLVGEMADALKNEIGKIEPDYDFVDSLVAKSREVVSKTETTTEVRHEIA